jgi:2,4-diketo-3-deoxy-L-fuconate hydrolase
MKLIRHGDIGSEKPGILAEDGARIDASSFGEDYTEAFFESGGLMRLGQWALRNASTAPRVASTARWAAPVCRPSKIVCIGLNYRNHARETGAEIPKEPILFF